jgi:hypothetical protein
MEILVGLVILAFIIGLFSRSKGDGLLDTIGSGCSTIIAIIIAIIIVIFVVANK